MHTVEYRPTLDGHWYLMLIKLIKLFWSEVQMAQSIKFLWSSTSLKGPPSGRFWICIFVLDPYASISVKWRCLSSDHVDEREMCTHACGTRLFHKSWLQNRTPMVKIYWLLMKGRMIICGPHEQGTSAGPPSSKTLEHHILLLTLWYV